MESSFSRPGDECLPVALTPFVGRLGDLSRLSAILRDPTVRLVTLLGPGGIGKTRLSLELSRILRPGFNDGIVFVPLGDFNTSIDLLPVLLGVLGVQISPGANLRQALFDYLAPRQLLLVLDNFECALEGAMLVRDILAAAPQVRALATSREKLNLQSEVIYRLQGLELPGREAPLPASEYDAVRLFGQKARQANPSFSLRDDNLPAVLKICRLVEGMPLGILLAAAWMELFSPQEIAGQVECSLDFLAGQQLDIPPRHRSLRAVFDSSFERLNENWQNVFIRLSIFRAGFTLDAAQAVAGASLPLLLGLVNKSLLNRDPASGRYSLHNLLGQYAAEKLSASGDFSAVRKAHAVYFLNLLIQSESILKSDAQLAALDAIQTDFENIRNAWAWAVEQGDISSIRSATRSLYAYCDTRDRSYDGEALFRQALQGLAPYPDQSPNPALALALLSWDDLHSYIEKLGPSAELAALASAYHEQAQLACDPEATGASLVVLGTQAERKRTFPAAIQLFEQGLHADPSLDDYYWITLRIGLSYQAMGQYSSAIQYFQKSLKRSKALGERVTIGWTLLNTGETLFLQGDFKGAAECLRQASGLFAETGTVTGILWACYSLARVALASGELAEAKEDAEAAMQIALQIQSAAWISKVSDLIAQISASPAAAISPRNQGLVEPLSERELDVLKLLKTDLSGPEIADQLMVSLNTVRYHTKNIYQKLQVNTRREALSRAADLGL